MTDARLQDGVRAHQAGDLDHAERLYRDVLNADWSKPSDVKAQFGSASVLQDGRVVFNIGGNKYRIVVWINFPYRVVYIRFIGTHKQYDAIDAQSI